MICITNDDHRMTEVVKGHFRFNKPRATVTDFFLYFYPTNFSVSLLLAPFSDNYYQFRTAIEYSWQHSDILKNHNVNCNLPSCTIAAHRDWSTVMYHREWLPWMITSVSSAYYRYDLKNDFCVRLTTVTTQRLTTACWYIVFWSIQKITFAESRCIKTSEEETNKQTLLTNSDPTNQ